MHRPRFVSVTFALAALAILPSHAHAQARKLRVLSADSVPIMYAYVTTDGGIGLITDEKGEISFGAGKSKTYTVNVRRLGFQPWFGKLTLPDTAAVFTVVLPRVSQALSEVRVTGRASAPAGLQAFYDRWMMRQKGLLSAVFIGPEEIEFRHPNRITNMLNGLNGVSLKRNQAGDEVAMGFNGQCQMAIVVDGIRQCPTNGCKCDGCGGNATGIMQGLKQPILDDAHAVLLDHVVDAASVAAIEVYPRGGNMPVSLQIADAACGVIAIWTGTRQP